MAWPWHLGVGDRFFFSNVEPEHTWALRDLCLKCNQDGFPEWRSGDLRQRRANPGHMDYYEGRSPSCRSKLGQLWAAAGEDNKRGMPVSDRKHLLLNWGSGLMRIGPTICETLAYSFSCDSHDPGSRWATCSELYLPKWTEVEWPAPGHLATKRQSWALLESMASPLCVSGHCTEKPSRTWSPAWVPH